MMLVEETTIPTAALPVDAFKAHLQLGTGFADDALQVPVLESFLRASLAAIEGRTGKMLLARDFSISVTAWRDTRVQTLPVAPVMQLLSITSIDAAGIETPLSLTDYYLDQDQHAPKVAARVQSLPPPPSNGQIKLEFTAGFGATFLDLPSDLQQAVFMLATHYYENRNAVGMNDASMPFGVSVLVERYKTLRILGGARG